MIDNMLAITLGACVQKLGFMSTEHGDLVKKILADKNNFAAKLALGMYLDACLKEGNYNSLNRAMEEFDKKDLAIFERATSPTGGKIEN